MLQKITFFSVPFILLLLFLTNALIADEHKAYSFYQMGQKAEQKKNYKKAVEFYNKALKVKPDFYEALNRVALLLTDYLSDYKSAQSYYKKIIKLANQKKNTEWLIFAYNDLGIMYYKSGEYNKSIEHYILALKLKEKLIGKDHPDLANNYNIDF